MKLLLHIGSHKTGSTSIQHFCALNRELLKSLGFLYPKNQDSAYVFNYLASHLAFGRKHSVRDYMNSVSKQARQENCHTVIISAESFYAMTAFFIDIQGMSRVNDDYWTNEERLIRDLHESCDGYGEIDIVCYLRAQNELASSLYNQFVKNTFGISDSFVDFLKIVAPIFDYERHIQLWENVFGFGHLRIKNFASCKENLIEDFCDSFLNTECFAKAKNNDFYANTRLNRDVLEFKRIFNGTRPDPALAFVSARCFRSVSEELGVDDSGYQVFVSSDFTKSFFGVHEEGNKRLSEKHGVEIISSISNGGEPCYPGLSAKKILEIHLRFTSILDQPSVKMELRARRFANFIKSKVPGGRKLLVPIRALLNQWRLKFSGW